MKYRTNLFCQEQQISAVHKKSDELPVTLQSYGMAAAPCIADTAGFFLALKASSMQAVPES